MNWDEYPNFTEDEFRCKCGCGNVFVDEDFLDKLQAMRTTCGFPFVISSGFRCKDYDKSIGGKGAHQTGQAVDIVVYGSDAFELLAAAHYVGILRIGQKQHGPHEDRFVHLDTLSGGKYPSPWPWTYK